MMAKQVGIFYITVGLIVATSCTFFIFEYVLITTPKLYKQAISGGSYTILMQ